MSSEAIEIMTRAQAVLNEGVEDAERKTLRLERFESFGDQRDGLMVVSVGKQKVTFEINDMTKAMQQVSSFVKLYEVKINTPMDEGYDLQPSVKNQNEMIRVTRASRPVAKDSVPLLVDAVRKGEAQYEKLLAEHEARKSAPKQEAADPEKDALKARADELGIDYKGTWGVPKLTAAIAEAEAAQTVTEVA